MIAILQRESIYLWYYFVIQFEQIFMYWLIGMAIGSFISVCLKDKIHTMFLSLSHVRMHILTIIIASILGIVSPLCMYGTIPIAASFSKNGMKDDLLAAFMMSSILLNPQLILYSGALGIRALIIRIVSAWLCGIVARLLIHYLYCNKPFFNFMSFDEIQNKDQDPNVFVRYFKSFSRNVQATGPYFLAGIVLSALFQRYVPAELINDLFGTKQDFGIFLAATIGVPLYACGGGTIPLLQTWLYQGMSLGSATAFMLSGPATKITNLGALKIVLGKKRFLLYFLFVMIFSFLSGIIIDIII